MITIRDYHRPALLITLPHWGTTQSHPAEPRLP